MMQHVRGLWPLLIVFAFFLLSLWGACGDKRSNLGAHCLSLDQPNGFPRLLPYNWFAIAFPPLAFARIALGISMMVSEVSGR
jgi:hypothetical protein